jgi:RNA recognition motif-containing protein
MLENLKPGSASTTPVDWKEARQRDDEQMQGLDPPAELALFIGGIPLQATFEELHRYLSQFDEVVSLFMPRDSHSKVIKGYAKAHMKTEEGALRTLRCPRHVLRGLEIGISQWIDKTQYLSQKDLASKRKVFVKYHPMVTEGELEQYFQQFGVISQFENKSNHITKEPRYFCYITFEDAFSAKVAADQSIHEINGKWVTCLMSKPSHVLRSEKRGEVGDCPQSYGIANVRCVFGSEAHPSQEALYSNPIGGAGAAVNKVRKASDKSFKNVSSISKLGSTLNTTAKDLGTAPSGSSLPTKKKFNRMFSIESNLLDPGFGHRFESSALLQPANYPSSEARVARATPQHNYTAKAIRDAGPLRLHSVQLHDTNKEYSHCSQAITPPSECRNEYNVPGCSSLAHEHNRKPTLKSSRPSDKLDSHHETAKGNLVFRVRSTFGRPVVAQRAAICPTDAPIRRAAAATAD